VGRGGEGRVKEEEGEGRTVKGNRRGRKKRQGKGRGERNWIGNRKDKGKRGHPPHHEILDPPLASSSCK